MICGQIFQILVSELFYLKTGVTHLQKEKPNLLPWQQTNPLAHTWSEGCRQHPYPKPYQYIMPFLRPRKPKENRWKDWDQNAQKNGLKNTVYTVNGDEYTGEWRDNKKHGKGTQRWKFNSAIYDGDWQYGKRNGFGTYSLPDPVSGEYKKVYSGEWQNDKRHGLGTNFYSDDDIYEGHWYFDKRDGWGRMFYADCSTYEGEWSDDLPNGEGMLRLANDSRYEGFWKDGMKHGTGKFFFFEKGQLYDGVWIDDIPKCGKMIDFGREDAIDPTLYPIPQLKLRNSTGVLEEARSKYLDGINENTSQHLITSTT